MDDNPKQGPQPVQARQATPAEVHGLRSKEHREQAERHARASEFLSAHPEFVEFLELLRSGILQ